MRINQEDLYAVYHARVTQFTEQPLTVEKEIVYTKGKLMPIVLNTTVKAKTMYLELDFTDKHDIFTLLPLLQKEFTLELDEDRYEDETEERYRYTYRCLIPGMGNNVTWDDAGSYTVGFDVLAIKEGPLQTIVLAKEAVQVVNGEGTYPASCRYVVHADEAVTDFKIQDITIKQMDAGETIVIDGEAKTVRSSKNGMENAFDRVALVNFPSIQPGANTITMEHYETVTVELRYAPVYF